MPRRPWRVASSPMSEADRLDAGLRSLPPHAEAARQSRQRLIVAADQAGKAEGRPDRARRRRRRPERAGRACHADTTGGQPEELTDDGSLKNPHSVHCAPPSATSCEDAGRDRARGGVAESSKAGCRTAPPSHRHPNRGTLGTRGRQPRIQPTGGGRPRANSAHRPPTRSSGATGV